MKKPNIEDIFSALESYATPPPPEVWEGIAAQLDEPQRKKRTLFWWSVAASLVLGLSLGGLLLFSDDNLMKNDSKIETSNKIVIDESDQIKNKEQIQDSVTIIQNEKVNAIVSNNSDTAADVKEKHNLNQLKVSNQYGPQKPKESIKSSVTQKTQQNSLDKHVLHHKQLNNPLQNSSVTVFSQSNAVALESANNQTLQNQNTNSFSKKQIDSVNSVIKLKVANELQLLENLIAKTDETKDKLESIIQDERADKWSVGVYAGVANSTNYSNKKVLGAAVASKQSAGFGLKTNYKLNKNWGVSAGLKISELGQSLANVSYYNKQTNLAMGIMTNDFFKVNQNVAYLSSDNNYVFGTDNSNNKSSAAEELASTSATATIDQNLQYLEMPLEISYSLFTTKKANIRFNTGGFLGKLISNEVTLDGTSIGKNLQVNDFVYGSKLSSTIQYEVLKKTNLFVEPGMNYYINPIKNNSFNQFQWGLNFGINVNF